MEFVKTDSQRYIQNVELLPSGELQWISGRGVTHFLILKVPLGYHPHLREPAAQKWLAGFEVQLIGTGCFADPDQKIEGTLLDASDFFRSGAKYKVTGGNVCYYVYGATVQNGCITCYALNNVGGDVEYCAENLTRADIYSKDVSVTRKTGLFRKEKKHFLRIRIETNDVLNDQDLYYKIGEYMYPIQRSMLKRDFYLDIPTDTAVEFCSRTGVKISYKED